MLNVAAHVPDYLPDHELGQLVAGLGNHEVKALLCVGMRPGVQYTGRDMAQEINDLQGSQPAWPIHPSNTTDYCRHSLEPAGLVRRVGGSAAIYVKTDYGSVVGDAVAGHLLDLSSRLPETALLNIFGKTGSTSSEGNIAAHNRIALYRYLLASSVPVRVSDALSRSYFGLASGHLHAMERDGLVTIETQNPRNDLVHYSVVDTERLQSLRLLSVSSDVREVVLAMHASDSSRMITTSAVIDELISRFPQYAELTKQDIKRKVSSKLRLFSSSGALEKVKVASTQSGRRHSDIYLTDDQRTILSDCLAVAQGIQALDKSFIDQGKKKAAAIVANPHVVRSLIAKARAASPFTRRKPLDDWTTQIAEIIEAKPGLTTRQIATELGELSLANASRIINIMAANNAIQRVDVATSKRAGWVAVDSCVES